MNWIVLFAILASFESSNNPNAFNASENAVGIFQIRQCVVDDLNRHYNTDYELEDFYNVTLSKWAVIHYSQIYCKSITYENVLRTWHGGPIGINKKATYHRWARVKNKVENLGS